MVNGYAQSNVARSAIKRCRGMTLVEVMVASFLVLLMVGGLLAVGIKVRRFGEHTRLATEAQGLGKERVEQIIAAGRKTLANPDYLGLRPDTNFSALGYPIIRSTRVIWHSATGGVVIAPVDAEYAEVHVDVKYQSTLFKHMATNTFSMLIR